jgi:hypothetical protein
MTGAVGYSGKPLAAKLGAKTGQVWLVVAAPEHFDALIADAPPPLTVRRAKSATRAARGPFDMVHLFCADAAALDAGLAACVERLGAGAALWVSWPKTSSPRFIDLTEDAIRASAFPLGLVDVKVCAVDADWSGLKLMRRRKGT